MTPLVVALLTMTAPGTRVSRAACGSRLYCERPWGVSDMNYEGGLLGVQARVALFPRQERALIKLRGLPIGGSISGVARFKSDGWSIALDSDMERALARRHVKIVGAGAMHDYSKVWVIVRLPLGIGKRTLILPRSAQ